MPDLTLSRGQRNRLLAEDYSPLTFPTKPECGKGDTYVLTWSRERRIHNGHGVVSTIPRERLRWIEVTKVVRTTTGWTVWFTVHDRRTSVTLLRRVPPRHDASLMSRDHRAPPTSEEIAQAGLESSYTTDVRVAVDELEAVPPKEKLRGVAELHREQRRALERAAADRLDLPGQLASLLADARERGVDVRDRERRIRREMELLERDLTERAA